MVLSFVFNAIALETAMYHEGEARLCEHGSNTLIMEFQETNAKQLLTRITKPFGRFWSVITDVCVNKPIIWHLFP